MQPQATTVFYKSRTIFVGRELERARLHQLLDQALRGEGSLVMIGREPGVAKTRLASSS